MASEPWQRTCGRSWEVSLANDSPCSFVMMIRLRAILRTSIAAARLHRGGRPLLKFHSFHSAKQAVAPIPRQSRNLQQQKIAISEDWPHSTHPRGGVNLSVQRAQYFSCGNEVECVDDGSLIERCRLCTCVSQCGRPRGPKNRRLTQSRCGQHTRPSLRKSTVISHSVSMP